MLGNATFLQELECKEEIYEQKPNLTLVASLKFINNSDMEQQYIVHQVYLPFNNTHFLRQNLKSQSTNNRITQKDNEPLDSVWRAAVTEPPH